MAVSAKGAPSPCSEGFAQALLDWASGQGRRDLPWQPRPEQAADPYRVWVSEVMLQQTQVKTMRPFFVRFMARFPTVQQLASASEQEVLAHWSGLGYYARARNLHSAAQKIVAMGSWPQGREAWERLPGVGRSTAAAVVSIAWGQREAILDGNVRRVLARQLCAEQPWGSAALAGRLWPEAEARLPRQSAAMPQYTQALMDLGALVCLPRLPRCAECPVRQSCGAARAGRQADYPVRAIRRVRPERTEHWVLRLRESEVFLWQRPAQGIWGGLWSLPQIEMPTQDAVAWGRLRHGFTHFLLSVQIWRIDEPEQAGEEGFWVSIPRALVGPLPSPVRKILERL